MKLRLKNTTNYNWKLFHSIGTEFRVLNLKIGEPARFLDDNGQIIITSTVTGIEIVNGVLAVKTRNSVYTFE